MVCTGKCKHCSEGEHTNYTGHIETDVAVIAIREVCENYKIEPVKIFAECVTKSKIITALEHIEMTD